MLLPGEELRTGKDNTVGPCVDEERKRMLSGGGLGLDLCSPLVTNVAFLCLCQRTKENKKIMFKQTLLASVNQQGLREAPSSANVWKIGKP